ncbi:hypothetical protein [Aeromicrobium alkaliterrae]|uniref:Uncharacterized protein n=1 Tax=Aeromicrobium alkaliterrae TaxID=302168 RepID=A0ABN2K568_9ACTN
MSAEWLAWIGAGTGLLGAVTGVVSLAWQIVAHRSSGRLVKVEASYVIPVYGPPHAPEFRDDDQVSVSVINRGGAPVSVLNFGVSISGRTHRQRNLFVPNRHAMSSPLPAVVDPGGEPVTVHIPVADLRRVRSEEGVPFTRMWPWVELGDGRKLFADKSVPLK